jgi:hypothetical protein
LGGARGLGHLAVSDFAIDEVATLLWEENDPRRNRRRDFSSRTIQLLMGKSVGNYMGTLFPAVFWMLLIGNGGLNGKNTIGIS